MSPEQFCYWLQGRAELVETPPSEAEWKRIKEHLALVFVKVTPLAPTIFQPAIPIPCGPWSNPPYISFCEGSK